MKNIYFFGAFIILSGSLLGQEICSYKLGIGAGITTGSFNMLTGNQYNLQIPAYQVQLSHLSIRRNWQNELCIGFLQTGVGFDVQSVNITLELKDNPQHFVDGTPKIKYKILNNHFTISRIVGYMFSKHNKFSLCTGIRVEAFINCDGRSSPVYSFDINPSGMGNNSKYNQFSLALVFKCDVHYNISDKISIWCSPTYHNMATSLTVAVPEINMGREYDRAFVLNTGITYHQLHNAKKIYP